MGELFLVAGLGNPGSEYAQTRHNVGFEVVKELLRRHPFSDKKASKQALTNRGTIQGREVLLVRPRTYMNLSGDAVVPLMQVNQVPLERLLVVLDEFALPLGRLRLRGKGSAGGQNGLKHILARLGTDQVARLRVGIGPLPEDEDPADFVLSPFTRQEQELLPELLVRAADCVEAWLTRGTDSAMSEFNSSGGKNREDAGEATSESNENAGGPPPRPSMPPRPAGAPAPPAGPVPGPVPGPPGPGGGADRP